MNEVTPNVHGPAVITGASSGIGKVYADRLASRGYDLILVARRADRLRKIGEDLQARYQIKVQSLVADLTQPSDLSDTVRRVIADTSITLLVNNAGIGAVGPIAQTSRETLTSIVALNITAVSALTTAVLPGFLSRGSGTIINIGSVRGYASQLIVPIYGATKAYVAQFTRALQKQVAGTNIRVQLVTPTNTVSENWSRMALPLAKDNPAAIMSTEDCVDAALRGLDMGEEITIPSLQDNGPLEDFEETSEALFQATQISGQPAPRYGVISQSYD
jgi:short-subunit dehydrogenase